MARHHDTPSRSEIDERIEKKRDDMDTKESEIEVTVEDVETMREAVASLEFDGTSEGSSEIADAVERADDVTVDVFEGQDEELETLQKESEEYEDELSERKETNESDLGKLSTASAEIRTESAITEFRQAKEGALKDIDFLQDKEHLAQEAREASDRTQEVNRARVQTRSGR